LLNKLAPVFREIPAGIRGFSGRLDVSFPLTMGIEESGEKELLAALRREEPDAFRQLVEYHRNKVINTCYRIVYNREDAEELAQETFLEVHNSIGEFREKSRLSTWIYRIAVTKSLDFLRKRGRKKREGIVGRLLSLDDYSGAIAAPASSNPEAHLETQERRRVLRGAMDTLSDSQRTAFVLSKYDGLSYQEIADILETSLPSIESLIHRAKAKLQKRLYSYYKGQFTKQRKEMEEKASKYEDAPSGDDGQ
jgi:RNA polymerase sigma-70 factor (ECF subfamily)